MAGIYIHIPFCRQACHYCDFHFSTHTRLKEPLLRAIVREWHMRKAYLDDVPIKSLYLGGGTPSLLTIAELASILEPIARHVPSYERIEVTLEANPEDITPARLKAWRTMGINRLSIGVQSFQDELLRYLNRAHHSKEGFKSIQNAYKAGFDNVSVDLMYAVPRAKPIQWEADLKTVLQLQPSHIAAYSLTIEAPTFFGRQRVAGKLKRVPDDKVVAQFESLVDKLTGHRYEHYEVTQFCQPGRHAIYNTNYWEQGLYCGLGPGAHSYNGRSRQWNISHNQRYLQRIQEGIVPCTTETLTKTDHINEYIMNSLRTRWGCDMARLATQYEYTLSPPKHRYLTQLSHDGLVTITGQQITLTRRGMLLADQVATNLFAD